MSYGHHADPLARKIARGDRSQATAAHYASALGVTAYSPPTKPSVDVYSLPLDGDGLLSPTWSDGLKLPIFGVYAVGSTPIEAIESLARAKDWGQVANVHDLEGDDDGHFTWGRRFTAGGTGFKAAGQRVPGGYVVTWWK